jgi:uncharacterized protein (DUF2132 family)
MTTSQPNNLLHGITLETLLNDLVRAYGWEVLGRRIAVVGHRQFQSTQTSPVPTPSPP